MTLGEFLLQEWLPAISARIRPTTLDHYRLNIQAYVLPSLGNLRLQDVSGTTLNSLYAELLASGRCRGGGLSPKTVRHVHTTLHKSLNDAVRWGLLGQNPADRADPPKPRTPEMNVWSPEQLRAFLEFVRSDRLYAAWLLLATTGMRRGEVLGLRWRAVQLEAACLSVVQSLTVTNYRVAVSQPKTAKGRRSVALDRTTVAALRAHRSIQQNEHPAMAKRSSDTDYVFTRTDGSLIHPHRFTAWFDRLQVAADLPRIRLHDLRHSYASAALVAGIPAKVVSERLGHANVAITLDTYSHVLPSLQAEAADVVTRLILGTELDGP